MRAHIHKHGRGGYLRPQPPAVSLPFPKGYGRLYGNALLPAHESGNKGMQCGKINSRTNTVSGEQVRKF
ncbi:hypothetical protein DSM19430T_09030 [Desulfovibrio psychrotolerans]|uniref:Uncharacterized protein n=1 Tax=Desulfovibrio psychrotolerans TaxID=415242 RepID=A0A7J0BRA3_9BACT|nr:hypothetical protein DSM19430T_09030 [Desulfovibrio psychrotolerans]